MANDDYSLQQQPGSGYADAQNPASLYAGKNAKTPPAPKAPPGKAPGPNGEVTILASYEWRPPIDGPTEVKYLLDPGKKWHPSYADYVEITGVRMRSTPGNFESLMGMIAEYRPKSIKRLNFFTHSNRNVIGITGHLVPGDVIFDSEVDDVKISSYAAAGMTFTVGRQAFTLDDVRARFADDAIFVLYGCDIATDPSTLLTALRDLLTVSVIGFRTKNVYCPPVQVLASGTFNRKGEKIGVDKPGFACGTDSTRDWRSLIHDPNAVKVARQI